jgi:hypothetical protein
MLYAATFDHVTMLYPKPPGPACSHWPTGSPECDPWCRARKAVSRLTQSTASPRSAATPQQSSTTFPATLADLRGRGHVPVRHCRLLQGFYSPYCAPLPSPALRALRLKEHCRLSQSRRPLLSSSAGVYQHPQVQS